METYLSEFLRTSEKTGAIRAKQLYYSEVVRNIQKKSAKYDRIFLGDMFVSVLANIDIHLFDNYLKNIYPVQHSDILNQNKISKIYLIPQFLYSSIGYELFRLYMSIPECHQTIHSILRDNNKDIEITDGMTYHYFSNPLSYSEFRQYLSKKYNFQVNKNIDEIKRLAAATFISDINYNAMAQELVMDFTIYPSFIQNTEYIQKLTDKDINLVMCFLHLNKVYYYFPSYDKIIINNNVSTPHLLQFKVIRKTMPPSDFKSSVRMQRIFMNHIIDDNRILKNMELDTVIGLISRCNIFTNKHTFYEEVFKYVYTHNQFLSNDNSYYHNKISSFYDRRIYDKFQN